MKNLCIFVPTRNNPKLMDFYLKTIQYDLTTYDIDIYIYDTSDNNETEVIVKKYQNCNIRYKKNFEYPDKTTDLKIIETYSEITDQYKYIWLCGDGYIPDLKNVMPKIIHQINTGADVIHFIEKRHINNNQELIMNHIEYFKVCGWHATLYGATILSCELLKTINWNDYQDLRNTGFLYWVALFVTLDRKESRIVVLERENTIIVNPYKKNNSSYRSNGFVRFWLKTWPMVVDKLPDCYNEYKELTCKMMAKKNYLYNFNGLLKLRKTQNLNFNIVKENKTNIKKVTDVPLYKFYLISMIPVKLVPALEKCIDVCKNVIKK